MRQICALVTRTIPPVLVILAYCILDVVYVNSAVHAAVLTVWPRHAPYRMGDANIFS